MPTSYIYLLFDKSPGAARFKIGFSVDPYLRQLGFGQNIDLERSLQYACHVDDVHRIEKTLHFMFRAERLKALDVGGGDGATEWFSATCLQDVLVFLEAYRDRLGCGPATSLAKEIPKKINRRGSATVAGRKGIVRPWTTQDSKSIVEVIDQAVRLIVEVGSSNGRLDISASESLIRLRGTPELASRMTEAARRTLLVLPAPRWGAITLVQVRTSTTSGGVVLALTPDAALRSFLTTHTPRSVDRDYDPGREDAYLSVLLPAVERYRKALDTLWRPRLAA